MVGSRVGSGCVGTTVGEYIGARVGGFNKIAVIKSTGACDL